MVRSNQTANVLAVLAILIFVAPTALHSQGCASGNGRYTTKVSPRLVVFPVPSVTDFQAGWVASRAVTVRVRPRGSAQRGWELCIRSDDPDMGGYGKPISDLEWRPLGGSSWQQIQPLNQLLTAGFKGDDVAVEFRVRLDWDRDVPDTYSAVVTFETAKL
jgi:hypothetical protein